MKKYMHLTLVLFIIAALSGLTLGLTYELTKDAIAQVKIDKINNSMASWFSDLDKENENNAIAIKEPVKNDEDNYVIAVYEAKDKSDNLLGYLFETKAPESYGGGLSLLVGIDTEGNVVGMVYGNFNESGPGAGVRDNSEFIDQFNNISEVIDEDGNYLVDTVSGATYTSSATIKGVDAVINYFNENLKE